jgi:transposase
LAIHNLHILILKSKGIDSPDATCGGTGYSLTIKKNYEFYGQKLKDKAKDNSSESNTRGRTARKKLFT